MNWGAASRLLGSARVSRVGFGVSPKQSFRKFAMARRVRYPDQKAAVGRGFHPCSFP
jgi:hypothetical protein